MTNFAATRATSGTLARLAVMPLLRVVTALMVLLALGQPAVADQGPPTVRGVVHDADGLPIMGAEVRVDAAATTTDALGRFALEVWAWTETTMTIAAPGYTTRTLTIDPPRARALDIALRADAAEVIEITGRAPEATTPTAHALSGADIKALPGAGNDALRAVQSLPGVARIPFSFGGLVLRGAAPRDSQVLLDGVEVPIAFHFGGLVSFYPSANLEELRVTSGGFDVSAGRAQGGLVELTSRAPRTDRWRLGGEVGLLHSAASAEGPLPRAGGVLVGVRRSYLDAVVRPFAPADTPLPSYLDAQVRTQWGQLAGRGVVAPMLFGSLDRIADDETAANLSFVRLAVPYRRLVHGSTWRVAPWAGVDILTFEDANEDGSDALHRTSWRAGLRADVTRPTRWGHLRGGLDSTADHAGPPVTDRDDSGLPRPVTQRWMDHALWLEARVLLGPHAEGQEPAIALKPGLRVDHYGLSREVVVDLRLNASARLRDGVTLRQALGRFHQPPTSGDLQPLYGNPDLDSSYVDQAALGIEGELPGDIRASATAYYQRGHGLGVLARNPAFPDEDVGFEVTGLGPTFAELLEKQLGVAQYRVGAGQSRNLGLEVALRRDVGRTMAMLSYTFADAQRTDDPTRYVDSVSGTIGGPAPGPSWRPYALDQLHNLHLIAGIKLTHWQLGAQLTVASGNPYQIAETRVGVWPNDIVTSRSFARLPTYWSLDVRAARTWRKAHGDLVLAFDIQNATLHRNVEGYEVDDTFQVFDEIRGLPILPMISLAYEPR